jgi:hypothetical protein
MSRFAQRVAMVAVVATMMVLSLHVAPQSLATSPVIQLAGGDLPSGG